MNVLIIIVLAIISLVVVVSKLFFLAPKPWGVLVVYANVFYETFFKKLVWDRWPIDAATSVILTVGWWLTAGPDVAVGFLLVFCLAWGYALQQDRVMLNNAPGRQDAKMGRGSADRRTGGWVPAPNPDVLVILRGPVWKREGVYDLGDWPQGHQVDYELVVLNPTILRASFPLEIDLAVDNGAVMLERFFDTSQPVPESGEYVVAPFRIKAIELRGKPIDIRCLVSIGGACKELTLRMRSVFDPEEYPLQSAVINRWKGGAAAGFAWRGDMDMYDPTTFQSVAGLRHTLEVCRRYRVASSMYLSGRLSLVKEEHEQFCQYLGVDRDTPGIDDFIRFMKEEVSMALILDFPYQSEKAFALELGNHMYLHYDTHAAMDPGNNWTNMAKAGQGHYPWQSSETGSLAEQRDNALYNNKVLEDALGVRPGSWAVPGRGFDAFTSRAIEAAGFAVASDTNASVWVNVLKLPPPHHPKGTERLVELTKKYPGDPDNAYKLAMLKYWIGLARRRRQTFVFMAHHHLLRYEGIAGTHAAEAILRHVLDDCMGDFYVTTVYGLGWYWDRVLCPRHRCVTASVVDGARIDVLNTGKDQLDGIPVEVTCAGGKRLLVLADIPAGDTVSVAFEGSRSRSEEGQ